MRARVVTFDRAMFAKWMEERSRITSLDELEEMTRKSLDTLKSYLDELSEDDLDLAVQMPFPGSWTVADMVDYHAWNTAYHFGQISYIASLLDAESS